MKHTILILLSLFCLSARSQVYIGYSFAQIQLKMGEGRVAYLASGATCLLISTEHGDYMYYSTPEERSVSNHVCLNPTTDGYAHWVSRLNLGWDYIGDETFQVRVGGIEPLYCKRIFEGQFGKYFFYFW